MKFGVRKPSIKRSISARTTGRIKRSVKKTVNPLYGKKGMGYINDPKKAVYNKVYNKTTVGVKDIINTSGGSHSSAKAGSSTTQTNTTTNNQTGCFRTVFAILLIIIGLFTIPVGLIFIAIGILLLVLKSKNNNTAKQESPTSSDFEHDNAPVVNISVSTSSYYSEKCIAKNCTIERIDLGKLVGESSGTYAWSIYEISGIKTATNRKNKRYYNAISEKHVELLASSEGITNIEILSVKPCEAASEEQIKTALEMGISLPDGVSTEDAKAIIYRVRKSEDVVSETTVSKDLVRQFVRPTKSPTEQLARFALEKGVVFSAYVSEDSLLWYILSKLSLHDKLAFYAYCIVCDQNYERIGNMQDSPLLQKFHGFADWAEKSESVVKSLDGRDVSDYLKPNKRTSVYRAYMDYSTMNQ